MMTVIVAFLLSLSAFSAQAKAPLKERVDSAAKKVGCVRPAYRSAVVLPLFGKDSKTLIFGCHTPKEDNPINPETDIDRVIVMDPKNECGPVVPTSGGDRFHILTSEQALGKGENFYKKFYLPEPLKAGPYPAYTGADRDQVVVEPVLQLCRRKECEMDTLYVCHKRQWLRLGRD